MERRKQYDKVKLENSNEIGFYKMETEIDLCNDKEEVDNLLSVEIKVEDTEMTFVNAKDLFEVVPDGLKDKNKSDNTENTVNNLKSAFDNAKNSAEDLKKVFSSSKTSVEILQIALSSARDLVENLNMAIGNTRNAVENLQMAFGSAKNSVENLQTVIGSVQNSAENLEIAFGSARSLAKDSTVKIKVKNNEVLFDSKEETIDFPDLKKIEDEAISIDRPNTENLVEDLTIKIKVKDKIILFNDAEDSNRNVLKEKFEKEVEFNSTRDLSEDDKEMTFDSAENVSNNQLIYLEDGDSTDDVLESREEATDWKKAEAQEPDPLHSFPVVEIGEPTEYTIKDDHRTADISPSTSQGNVINMESEAGVLEMKEEILETKCDEVCFESIKVEICSSDDENNEEENSDGLDDLDDIDDKLSLEKTKIDLLLKNDLKQEEKIDHEWTEPAASVETEPDISALIPIVEIVEPHSPKEEKEIITSDILPSSEENGVLYHCKKCDIRFRLFAQYQGHVKSCSGEDTKLKLNGEIIFKCSNCNYTSLKQCNLKKHMVVHRGETPFRCKQCDYAASYLSNLKTHMRVHTGEKPFKCKECDYSASQLINLKIHLSTHTGVKPFKCLVCLYSCTTSSHLKRHMRRHTGEKPYKCHLCGYCSSTSSQLKRHNNKHNMSLKPVKCNLCEYSTFIPVDLKNHIRGHTKEKNFKCNECDYASSNSGNLRSHIRTHTGELPYKCSHCKYSASFPSNLKRHMEKHNKKNKRSS